MVVDAMVRGMGGVGAGGQVVFGGEEVEDVSF